MGLLPLHFLRLQLHLFNSVESKDQRDGRTGAPACQPACLCACGCKLTAADEQVTNSGQRLRFHHLLLHHHRHHHYSSSPSAASAFETVLECTQLRSHSFLPPSRTHAHCPRTAFLASSSRAVLLCVIRCGLIVWWVGWLIGYLIELPCATLSCRGV